MRVLIIYLLVAILPSISYGEKVSSFEQLTFITEHYPPYDFKTNDTLVGIAVDLLMAAAKTESLPFSQSLIKFYPWSRGYHALQKGPNVVLFSTTRTKKREKLFNGLAQLGQSVWCYFL